MQRTGLRLIGLLSFYFITLSLILGDEENEKNDEDEEVEDKNKNIFKYVISFEIDNNDKLKKGVGKIKESIAKDKSNKDD